MITHDGFARAMERLRLYDDATKQVGFGAGFLRDMVTGGIQQDVLDALYALAVNKLADDAELDEFVTYLFVEKAARRIRPYFPDRKTFNEVLQRWKMVRSSASPQAAADFPDFPQGAADVYSPNTQRVRKSDVLRWWKGLEPLEQRRVYEEICADRRSDGDEFTVRWIEEHPAAWRDIGNHILTLCWVMDYYERNIARPEAA